MSPVIGKRHDCEIRVHNGRRSGTNTARQSPVSGTRMRVHCLANSLRVPSRQTIVLNLYAIEGMLITGFTPDEVISSQ
jgi:hypothetical protein